MQSSIADMSTVQEGRMSSIESRAVAADRSTEIAGLQSQVTAAVAAAAAADHSSVIEQLTARIDTQVSTLQ